MSNDTRSYLATVTGSLFMALGAGIAASALGVAPLRSSFVAVGAFAIGLGAGLWRQA